MGEEEKREERLGEEDKTAANSISQTLMSTFQTFPSPLQTFLPPPTPRATQGLLQPQKTSPNRPTPPHFRRSLHALAMSWTWEGGRWEAGEQVLRKEETVMVAQRWLSQLLVFHELQVIP